VGPRGADLRVAHWRSRLVSGCELRLSAVHYQDQVVLQSACSARHTGAVPFFYFYFYTGYLSSDEWGQDGRGVARAETQTGEG
jgi:hypothetical protein